MGRVDIVVSHLDPLLGIENAAVRLARSLTNAGIEVRVIALLRGASVENSRYESINCGGTARGWGRVDPRPIVRAVRSVKGARTVILAGAWVALPFLFWSRLPLLRLRRSTKVIVWEHSFISDKIRTDRRLGQMFFAARILYPAASAIVAVSPPLAEELEAKFRRDIQVIPNQIDFQQADISENDATPRLSNHCLMIGSLTVTKNQQLMIEALASPALANVTVTIAGDGPMRADLEARAKELAVSHRVEFLGYVDKARISEELRKCTVVVHTSMGETFGYVYFEATAARRGVVAVNSRVAHWLIPDYVPGVLCAPTPDSLARAIAEMLPRRDAASFRFATSRWTTEFEASTIVESWRRLIS